MKIFYTLSIALLLFQLGIYAQIKNLYNQQKNIFSQQSVNTVNVNPDSVIIDSVITSEINAKSMPGLASIMIKDNKVSSGMIPKAIGRCLPAFQAY